MSSKNTEKTQKDRKPNNTSAPANIKKVNDK
jgi:hypothetical protein